MKQVIILESRMLSGGACESIKLLIENIGHKVDLIVPKGGADYITKRMIKQFYGENVNQVFDFFLPYNLRSTEGGEVFDVDTIQRAYRLYRKNRKELYKFLKKQKYDHIHLNGLGLYQMLSKRFPMTIHIRQIFNDNIIQKKIMESYLLRAKGIIYIDSATRSPFKNLNVDNVLINNPINQTPVNMYDRNELMKEFGFNQDDVIFTIVGSLCEVKGQEFLIRAFEGFDKYPYKLLIVGKSIGEYKERCNILAKNNPNIIFLGEVRHDEIFKIYRITDYIIRAERAFCIGRTVFEGLYSGNGLIIEGDIKDAVNIEDYDIFKDRIYFYAPRDIEKFRNVLYTICGKKCSGHEAITSATNYVKDFNNYIDKILFKTVYK